MTAGITLLDVSAERGRAAMLDGAHDTALTAAEFISVLPTVDGPELAKDVRHLEPRGAQSSPQKWVGSGAFGCGGPMSGSRSRGLVVAQMVLVATFR